MRLIPVVASLLLCSSIHTTANAQDLAGEIADLRKALAAVQQDYEARISDLEDRLARAEQLARAAKDDASEAYEIAEQTAIEQTSGGSAANTFNPAIGATVSGRYANIDRGWEEIPGFVPAGEIGTGEAGFALGEVELNMKANVDNRFFGNLTFAIHDESGEAEVELEEAWLQTTGLSSGLSLTGGRFFSANGYLNSFHRHADDFTDRPLPYQAFLGGQYVVDGLQARWIAPTGMLLELGTELNWGSSFPASENAEDSPSAYSVFAKLGGDVGTNNSWQLGVSWLSADAIERSSGHAHATVELETFTGSSDLAGIDFVWKWAPDGNSSYRNVKLQAEYFSRSESGEFDAIDYDGDQSGWYLQGVWQFRPGWRVGYRHDVVDADSGPALVGTELEDPGRSSSRDSLMLDWSPSEFSRLRLQLIDDRVFSEADLQWYLQYIMSIGAHGGHQF